ncbi:MAG: RNA polymerase sigma factor RpoH [Rhodocyclaceae bacterium]|jgi:RNA polymerase sigma-32 factor|nr:RNA polymerase sigma factor RpoH [Rhodocyclaceae bacterium]MCE2723727.1 RNA polymerase sigma factor RpoH [Betaproteobacteria bacterium]MCA3017637.1 RNA polymerase sigma factor RpoH [Rhodocyclaceae bacterium]MCA3022226.1 RNA polymerase sigma factor RpoH [Rhodocyclaceae bacterium]MCA3024169.1 RNA polymerase sigma factor RpoH [Rhodocyclaceae bacterium]
MSTASMNLPALSVASLENYISTVNRIPMLTPEREYELGVALKTRGDLAAASELVMSHLRLVVSIARNYAGYGLQQSDLIQEGNIGLMKAVKRFDPDRGVRLVSFAVHWIKAEMHEYILKNWRIVKVATTKAQRKLFFNLRSMKPNFGTLSPTEVKEVARQLNVKETDVSEMEKRLTGQEISLEPNDGDDESWISPIAYLADNSVDPAERLGAMQKEIAATSGMEAALATLDDRSRRIIETRWLNEGGEKTLHELAAEYGVSAERIRQIEAKAMQKMKLQLQDYAAA